MRIYYDEDALELLTEEEAIEHAKVIVQSQQIHLALLNNMKASNIWEMLTLEAQEEILEEATNVVLDGDFISREFDE